MGAEQKRAWLVVITLIVCVVLFAVLMPFLGLAAAPVAFSLLGLNGFGVLIGRGEKEDERDRSIARRATLGGAMASYLTFVLSLMGTWAVVYMLRGDSQISVHALPMIVMLGFVVFISVRAIAVLAYYRRHTEADNV